MNNAMPTHVTTLDNPDAGYTPKALQSVAAGFLALLPKNGRPVSLGQLTEGLWVGSNSHCRHDTKKLARALEALCKGTGVACTVKENPACDGDWIISLRY